MLKTKFTLSTLEMTSLSAFLFLCLFSKHLCWKKQFRIGSVFVLYIWVKNYIFCEERWGKSHTRDPDGSGYEHGFPT